MTKTETYEEKAKDLFKKEPANMKLLVVVDKLLTGFDAPSCISLRKTKACRITALFQAICRTNRLDGKTRISVISSITRIFSGRWAAFQYTPRNWITAVKAQALRFF